MDCLFCKIISGEIPSYKIYEDSDMFAFLDINPISVGHTLIIPKKHILDIMEIDDELLIKMVNKAKDISKILNDKLETSGFTITQNNGSAQDIKHFHLHVIPRYDKKKELEINEAFEILTK